MKPVLSVVDLGVVDSAIVLREFERKMGNWKNMRGDTRESREDTPMLRPDFAQQERCGNTSTWNVS